MQQRMPSLNQLRTFEAAAQWKSFTQAAKALNVSPGAVSRQIQLLEEHVGFPLFVRRHRAVHLTEQAQVYYRDIHNAFMEIAAATERLKQRAAPRRLRLCSYPTFGLHWLVPALNRFREAHPEIEVSLATSIEPVDFDRAQVDGAVAVGYGQWPDLHSVKLTDFDCTAVCSPALPGFDRLREKPERLREHTLLHVSTRRSDWAQWFSSAGLPPIAGKAEISFDNLSLATEAAVQGMGVVMGILSLLRDDLDAGRLAQPFRHIRIAKRCAYLVYPKKSPPNLALERFAAFLERTSGDKRN